MAPDAAGCDDLIAIRTKLHLEADMANRNPATVGWKNGGFNGTKMIYIYIYIYTLSHTCDTKWAWKCDPRLTEMDALSSLQEA